MRKKFSLFQNHLDLAHKYWEEGLRAGDTVIDATCGNGHDTLKLCQLVLSESQGKVYAYDIQHHAIKLTTQYLAEHLSDHQFKKVKIVEGCHSKFSEEIVCGSIGLVVYNLGYLPGGNKNLTTRVDSTLKSIRQAMELLKTGGFLSITCYPGHEEGSVEEHALVKFSRELSPQEWNCCHHQWLNRQKSPSLLIIQKAI